MADVRHHQVKTNGVEFHVVEAGPSDGPAVVLSHGFPELWYSWRSQIEPLAEAGYHVICPDQRGYGGSTVLPRVEDYGIEDLTGDLLGLLEEFGHREAVFVGHDWGAMIVWGMARLHPERVRALCAMSVPLFSPPEPPTEHFRRVGGPDFYVLEFMEPGSENMLVQVYGGDYKAIFRGVLGSNPTPDADETPTMRDTVASDAVVQLSSRLPDWLSEADLDYYGDQFAKTGFFGGISYYRNLDANWRLMKDIPYEVMAMPVLFVTGALDFVHQSPWYGIDGVEPGVDAIAAMGQVLPDFRGAVFIDGAGHWNQQENAPDTTAAVLEFLAEVSPIV